MSVKKDYTGRKFHHLTFIKPTKKTLPKAGYVWLLECDCGNDAYFPSTVVVRGQKKSCGCLRIDGVMNRVGQKFGRLTFIAPTKKRNSSKHILWECLCDCGNTVYLSAQSVVRGNVQSCGCLLKESTAKNGTKGRKFHPVISAARRVWMATYDDGDIDFDTFYSLSQQNCYYCGLAPYHPFIYKYGVGKSETAIFTYNGLDRIDSTEGHIKANVVPCCHTCNIMKNQLTLIAFVFHIVRIFLYRCVPFLFGLGLLYRLLPTRIESNEQGIELVDHPREV